MNSRLYYATLLALLAPALLRAQTAVTADPLLTARFDSAWQAWDAGRYPEALERLQRLLATPGSDALLEPVALLTGELYTTLELTKDGRAPRWSGDGRFAAFETGTGAARATHVVAYENGALSPVVQLTGYGLVFSPDGRSAAYFSSAEVPQIRAARADLDRLTAAGDTRGAQQKSQEIARLDLEHARIVLRDLASGRDRELNASDVTRGLLAFGGNGDLYLIGGTPGQTARDRIERLTGAAPGMVLAGGSGTANIASARALSGPRLLLGLGGGGGRGGGGGGGGRGGFAIFDASTAALRPVDGTSPSASADGSRVVYLTRQEGEQAIAIADVAGAGAPTIVKRSALDLASPALSPDGRRVAFQMMPREDWELYVIGADGSGEMRITREIQHDLLPQFVAHNRILAVMGEARHRRSYLYELDRIPAAAPAPDTPMPAGGAGARMLSTGPGVPERVRLFHNNTVRTVAPEYEWVPSPDGTKVLIVAERDGDTVSPERGVYLMDLGRRVPKDEVLRRVAASHAHETALRTQGARMFEPIAPAVRDAVAHVSTGRIFGYAHDLFQFDSKFITEPGNLKAIEYIAATLRSWGYEPELQWFEARGVRTANIIAKLRGTVNPELIYVVSSHFDSVQRGPGADDDSSGTTALLEAARVLKDRPQPATIHFAFFTGEEAGLLGSREYVRRAVANGDRIVGALNNDMIGFANDHRLDNTIRYSNDGIRDIQHAAAFLFTGLITYDAKYYRSTDAAAYYEAYGDIVGGIGSYPILGNPHYHQSHDVLETINQQLVAEVSKTTVGTLMLLASSPARVKDLVASRQGGTAEVRWAPAPESGVREYVVAWGPAAEPMRRTLRVTEARASLPGVNAGDVVRVKAVGARGLESWDWARTEVR
jgi:hypothetical protein